MLFRSYSLTIPFSKKCMGSTFHKRCANVIAAFWPFPQPDLSPKPGIVQPPGSGELPLGFAWQPHSSALNREVTNVNQFHKPPIWEWCIAPIKMVIWRMVYYWFTHIGLTNTASCANSGLRPCLKVDASLCRLEDSWLELQAQITSMKK